MERSDIELMLCAQKGNLSAFQELTRRYREPLRRFFASLLLDQAQADDCVQETFLRLWLLRREYQPTGKFSTYLFQIGKHHLLNQKRKLRAQANDLPVETAHEIAAPEQEQPEFLVLRQDKQARVRQAIERLPSHLREVVERSYMRQHTYAEIACQLQIPVGTVKSRMSEATRRLRQMLQGEMEVTGKDSAGVVLYSID
jgi:RNA polymerase sigma-70 factor, ECF subfamily